MLSLPGFSVNRMARQMERNIRQYKWRGKCNRSREIWTVLINERLLADTWL